MSRPSKQPCVYIVASRRNGTLYLGVTSDLIQRVWQHKNGFIEGFTRQHRVHVLVWFEPHATMDSAIAREKALKQWRRAWKVNLIEQVNPYWRDLYDELL
ncbi:GIY-YIG nuclease family protein [Dokdonella soli]|uniref:GIY-YIG nuclease family protein n=1 Tax=Dokdonella soli TaxID=529810 RepID=A0ABN1IBX5_9GAMM